MFKICAGCLHNGHLLSAFIEIMTHWKIPQSWHLVMQLAMDTLLDITSAQQNDALTKQGTPGLAIITHSYCIHAVLIHTHLNIQQVPHPSIRCFYISIICFMYYGFSIIHCLLWASILIPSFHIIPRYSLCPTVGTNPQFSPQPLD